MSTAQPHHFTEEDVQVLQRIVDRISLAIGRAQIYKAEQETTQRMGEFLSTASHELHTPATSLKGTVQLLLRQTEHASTIGSDVSQYAQKQSAPLSPIFGRTSARPLKR